MLIKQELFNIQNQTSTNCKFNLKIFCRCFLSQKFLLPTRDTEPLANNSEFMLLHSYVDLPAFIALIKPVGQGVSAGVGTGTHA